MSRVAFVTGAPPGLRRPGPHPGSGVRTWVEVVREGEGHILVRRPRSGEEAVYPDADPEVWADAVFAFARY